MRVQLPARVNSLKTIHRELKQSKQLCEEWDTEPTSFYDWAIKNGFSNQKYPAKINKFDLFCPNNTIFESKEEINKARFVRDGSKTYIYYNAKLECWVCTKYLHGKPVMIGFKNTRQGILFLQWAYCVANGLVEPEFKLKKISNQKKMD